MKRNFLVVGGGIVTILVIAGLFGWQRVTANAAANNARVQTATVTRGTLVATVNAAGNVSAPQEATIAFQTSGRVVQVNVQAGDVVKQGQVLLQLDPTDLQLALQSAQANLASAQANYDSAKTKTAQTPNQLIVAKAALDKATAALQRAQREYDQVAWRPDLGMTTQSANLQSASLDYQSAAANYQIATSSLSDGATLILAQAQLDRAQIAVDQAQANLAKASLIAPFDGIVAAVNYNVGDTPGLSPAADIVDVSNLQVKVMIAEVDMSKIKVGETAQMTVDALPGKMYRAKVIAFSPVGMVTQGVVNYPVTVAITNPDRDIKSGMTANLAVSVDRRENVLLVPTRAVRTQGNQKTVTVEYKGQSIEVPVGTGLSNDTQVEITNGLQEGDVVLLNQTQTSQSGGAGQMLFMGGAMGH